MTTCPQHGCALEATPSPVGEVLACPVRGCQVARRAPRQLALPGAAPARRKPAQVTADREELEMLQAIAGLDSLLEARLLRDLRRRGLPEPIPGYQFHPQRGWRFDFAWPDLRLAVECEGGTWVQGRHNRGAGYRQDCEKYNGAAIAGWCLLRYTTEEITSGEAAQEIALVVRSRAPDTNRPRRASDR